MVDGSIVRMYLSGVQGWIENYVYFRGTSDADGSLRHRERSPIDFDGFADAFRASLS